MERSFWMGRPALDDHRFEMGEKKALFGVNFRKVNSARVGKDRDPVHIAPNAIKQADRVKAWAPPIILGPEHGKG
jgi:hypothetical protein